MNFTPAGASGLVDCFLLVKTVDRKTSSKGDAYLDMTLADKTGEINAKLWSYVPAVHGEYAAGDIVKVRGTVSLYNGNEQLRVEKIRKATDADGTDPATFVPSACDSGESMFDELFRLAEGFADPDLKAVVCALLNENRENLLFWPAASRMHHAIRAGLLMHTLSIVRVAEKICEIYPFLDRDLLLAGAILHDIAKTTEFEISGSGLATGYTVKGNLIGHLAEGAMMVRKTAEKLGVTSDVPLLLEHMILSHHGEPEFGAAVRPQFIEAEILSELDMLDARIYQMREAAAAATENTFTGKIWSMENRKLYNHGRADLEKTTKLF